MKELKAFKKVLVQPGERQEVRFILDRRAFEVYDPDIEDFVVEPGRFAVLVGSNAQQTPLHTEFSVC